MYQHFVTTENPYMSVKTVRRELKKKNKVPTRTKITRINPIVAK